MTIQPILKAYADALNSILKMEISITDENLIRVAGTNRHMSQQMARSVDVQKESGIMKYAMEMRQPVIVDNPMEHSACAGCRAKEICREQYNISIPILVDDTVLGGIALIAVNKRQRDRMEKIESNTRNLSSILLV